MPTDDPQPFQPFIPNENARKWADALESGQYHQTTGALETRGAFCCLGVACAVAIDEGLDIRRNDEHYGPPTVSYDYHTASLPAQVRQWLGLRDDSGLYDGGRSLIDDNDHRGHDFKRIALTIRTTPSLYMETADES